MKLYVISQIEQFDNILFIPLSPLISPLRRRRGGVRAGWGRRPPAVPRGRRGRRCRAAAAAVLPPAVLVAVLLPRRARREPLGGGWKGARRPLRAEGQVGSGDKNQSSRKSFQIQS